MTYEQIRNTPAPPAPPTPPTLPPPLPARTGTRLGRTLVAGTFALAVAAGGTVGGAIAGSRAASPGDAQAGVVEAQATPVVSASNDDGAVPETLLNEARDVSSLVAEALPGIVRITAQSNLGEGAGTGFVLSSDGRIATNAHVVADSSAVEVEFADGSTTSAVVLGVSQRDDLAVLQVDRDDLTALPVGSSTDLRVGEPVVAIGNALGFAGSPTATDGIVSALDRSITLQDGRTLDGLVQTDAAINPGNSGGPLLSLDGEVVGINSAGSIGAQNIGFAIGIDAALPILDQLATGEPIVQAFLGVATVAVDPDVAERAGIEIDSGLLITDVTVGSAAQVAGLRPGDVIVAVDGTDLEVSEDLGDVIDGASPGDEIDLDVVRNGVRSDVTATLGGRTV